MTTPDSSHRIAVIGRTGSGKTVFSVWLLGELRADAWSEMPITIFNNKGSKLISKLGAKKIDISSRPPKRPGLYVVKPQPYVDDAAVIDYLSRVYENQEHALYFDEVLEMGTRNRALRRLVTQGRELEIPMIYCSQRPAWIDKYLISEADFRVVFKLATKTDVKTITDDVPLYNSRALARFHCYWYDVGEDQGTVLAPVPSETEIIRSYMSEGREQMITHTNPDGSRETKQRVLL